MNEYMKIAKDLARDNIKTNAGGEAHLVPVL